MTAETDIEAMAEMLKRLKGAEPTQMRAIACSIYTALCVETNVDKDAALAELGQRFTDYQAFAGHLRGSTH